MGVSSSLHNQPEACTSLLFSLAPSPPWPLRRTLAWLTPTACTMLLEHTLPCTLPEPMLPCLPLDTPPSTMLPLSTLPLCPLSTPLLPPPSPPLLPPLSCTLPLLPPPMLCPLSALALRPPSSRPLSSPLSSGATRLPTK